MQTSKITRIAVVVLVLLFLALSVISCSTHVHSHPTSGKKIPPGQAKKMNGDQSAKAYAPGQQKKR
jgi:hypothetical protein